MNKIIIKHNNIIERLLFFKWLRDQYQKVLKVQGLMIFLKT